MTPPVSETAAWTEQDERTVEHYATRWELRDDILSGITMTTASRICREILRLRAENEALAGKIAHLLIGDHALRSQLAAATPERETPPTEPLHNVTPNPNAAL